MEYNNPIIPGFYPDPSICQKGDDYYLVTSSFEFFPGVPIFHSVDLVNWWQIGHVLDRPSQLDLINVPASKGIYAPTIRYNPHDNLFYMVTTSRLKIENFFVTASDPAGPWSDPILVAQGGIDPDLFFETNGTCYFLTNATNEPGGGFLMAPMNTKTGALLSPARPVWGGDGGAAPEAPHLYKIGEWYYQMIAEGGTELGHSITIARSKHLFGPYEANPANPILTHKHRKRRLIQGVGHGDLVQDKAGLWWMVFLGFRQTEQYFHHLGRETFLAPVDWVDGWPVINQNDEIRPVMRLPHRDGPMQEPRHCLNTNFAQGAPLDWIHLRNPRAERYRFDSGLHMLGCTETLSDVSDPTFLAIRQQDLSLRSSVELTFSPLHEYEEAGYSVFYKFDAHYEIGLTLRNGQACVFLRKVVGDICHEQNFTPVTSDTITLCIECDRLQYRFSVLDQGNEIPLGTGTTRHVSTEAHTLGFTGVMLALYASGNGTDCESWARFNNYTYEGLPEEEYQ